MFQDPIDAHVGQRVRGTRKACKISLEDLGAAIGTTYQQIQKYESGSNRISASMLWRIATRLGVNVSTLFPNCEHDRPDKALIARLERLPPHLIPIIADLADAIVAAERRATTPSDPAASNQV